MSDDTFERMPLPKTKKNMSILKLNVPSRKEQPIEMVAWQIYKHLQSS